MRNKLFMTRTHNPTPGMPEFDAWRLKRTKEDAAKYLTDEYSLGDDERGLLAA